MRLVSDNSEDDLQRRRADADLRRVLRGMAANLLRVVRGAGRPYQVVSDLSECLICCQAYREAFGYYPHSDLIREILDPEIPHHGAAVERQERMAEWLASGSEYVDAYRDREDFQSEAWRAGLQIAASMLVDQQTQLRRAESDLFGAVRCYKKSSEERAKKLTARAKTTPTAPKRLKKDRSPSPASAEHPPAPPTIKPAPQKHPQPAPPPRDPFEPPDYSGLRSASLPQPIIDEFGERSAHALVDRLNALWRRQGRQPLPQGSYPSNASQLNFVVKELRLALAKEQG